MPEQIELTQITIPNSQDEDNSQQQLNSIKTYRINCPIKIDWAYVSIFLCSFLFFAFIGFVIYKVVSGIVGIVRNPCNDCNPNDAANSVGVTSSVGSAGSE